MSVLAVCDGCRAEYSLADEHAGRKVQCNACGAVILVPAVSDVLPEPEPAGGPWREGSTPFDRDRFLIKPKGFSLSAKYHVYDERRSPILFVERPSHALRSLVALVAALVVGLGGGAAVFVLALSSYGPRDQALSLTMVIGGIALSIVAASVLSAWLVPRRHIFLYADDRKARLLLEVLQEQKLSVIRARYTVRDPEEGMLCRLQMNHLYKAFRKRWDAFRPDGSSLLVAREDSLTRSLLRRIAGLRIDMPPPDFVFLRPGTETVVGEFRRNVTVLDHYVLDLGADPARELDRRIAVALGILIDMGEKR